MSEREEGYRQALRDAEELCLQLANRASRGGATLLNPDMPRELWLHTMATTIGTMIRGLEHGYVEPAKPTPDPLPEAIVQVDQPPRKRRWFS